MPAVMMSGAPGRPMKLRDRVAVITGAAQGLGAAYARRFVADGARVVVADIQDEKGRELADELGPSVRYVHCDVTRKAEVDALMEAAVEAHGGLDICITNAGVVHDALFLEVTEAAFEHVVAVNVKGVFLTGQAAARKMVQLGRGGAIINIASTNSIQVNMRQIPYGVSKGAVVLLTRVMAVSLADHGIRVNAIGPGSVRTPMLEAVMRSDKATDLILSRTPLRRIAEPAEIANVAAFLASDDASYITGQTIYVDGGRLILNYTMPDKD